MDTGGPERDFEDSVVADEPEDLRPVRHLDTARFVPLCPAEQWVDLVEHANRKVEHDRARHVAGRTVALASVESFRVGRGDVGCPLAAPRPLAFVGTDGTRVAAPDVVDRVVARLRDGGSEGCLPRDQPSEGEHERGDECPDKHLLSARRSFGCCLGDFHRASR